MAEAAAGPLAGVRVVELATVVAGPGSGKYLADFGASVVKVESPSGDPTRRMGWTGRAERDSYFWKLLNRNKQVITLDLKSTDGRKSLWALLADADVLIENMRPGKLEALGFAIDELLRRTPRLVILRISGFGQDGPYAQHPGFATVAEALSGFSGLLGEPDGPPLLPPVALTDEVTALAGAFAVLAALRHAERTGEGQVVDVNLLESMFQIMGPLVSAYAHLGYLQPRLGSGIPIPCRAAPIAAPMENGSRSRLQQIASLAGCSTSSGSPPMRASPASRGAAPIAMPSRSISAIGSPNAQPRRSLANSAGLTRRSHQSWTWARSSATSISGPAGRSPRSTA